MENRDTGDSIDSDSGTDRIGYDLVHGPRPILKVKSRLAVFCEPIIFYLISMSRLTLFRIFVR